MDKNINEELNINNCLDKKLIYDCLQQREPFLMVDEIISLKLDNKRIVCRKTIKNDEWYLKGHFPDYPIVPGVLLVECMAQASAILLNQLTKSDSTYYFLLSHINDAKFKEFCYPGDKLIINCCLEKNKGNLFFTKCNIINQHNIMISECTLGSFRKQIIKNN